MKVCDCLESLPEFAEERFAQSAWQRVVEEWEQKTWQGTAAYVFREEWWVPVRKVRKVQR